MRVVIAEDDVLLREGLALLVAGEGFEVRAAVGNAEDFIGAVERHRPDIAVVGVRLPPGVRDDGVQAALAARRSRPGLPILALSSHVEDRCAAELLADGRGGTGYLLKRRVGNADAFLDAVRRVAAGGTAMDPEVIARLLVRRRAGDPLRTLTAREREVLGLMAEGHAGGDIAAALIVTEGAVNKHVRAIFAKLGLAPEDTGHRRVLEVPAYLTA
ncbi:response regulator transcription factor [Phytomonospora sp. NPDC050363]|uniref:response regulator transcription factor n=1 Tax=Phytomonospora sp. NPDC050363 TaxID=3155642 RepID=UPI0033ECDC15